MSIGIISNLFTKLEKGKGVKETNLLKLIEGYGIEGDINASCINPRHILLTSQSTLAQLSLMPGDLRENIVIKHFPVDALASGEALKIGPVELRILFQCEPCRFIETIREGLLNKIEHKRGVLAFVKSSGNIQIGDEVIKSKKSYKKIPYKVFDRFIWTLEQIPHGKLITYTDFIQGLGLFSQYYRVIPTYIKRVEHMNLPTHRIVDSNFNLIAKYVSNQKNLLKAEAIKVKDNKVVDFDNFKFDITSLF